jgi:hypothetical protein
MVLLSDLQDVSYKMETYLNLNGIECVIVTNDDGTVWSGLKSAYDEMLEQAEQSTPSLAVDAN